MSPELTLFRSKLILKEAHVVPITEHGEEPVPVGASVVALVADQALNALQSQKGLRNWAGNSYACSAQQDNEARNAAIRQRDQALATGTDPGSLPTVPPELDPISEYTSFCKIR